MRHNDSAAALSKSPAALFFRRDVFVLANARGFVIECCILI
jgi:hypothetical protein